MGRAKEARQGRLGRVWLILGPFPFDGLCCVLVVTRWLARRSSYFFPSLSAHASHRRCQGYLKHGLMLG